MTPPYKLQVLSDGNELTYMETTKANASRKTAVMYVYRYTVSLNKLNQTLSLTERELEKMTRKGIVKSIGI
jgi:hypothetical protein